MLAMSFSEFDPDRTLACLFGDAKRLHADAQRCCLSTQSTRENSGLPVLVLFLLNLASGIALVQNL